MNSNIIFDTSYNLQALTDIGIFLIFCMAIYFLFKAWDKIKEKKATILNRAKATTIFIPVNHTGQKTIIKTIKREQLKFIGEDWR